MDGVARLSRSMLGMLLGNGIGFVSRGCGAQCDVGCRLGSGISGPIGSSAIFVRCIKPAGP